MNKNILIYIGVLLTSFIVSGFLFSWLAVNNKVSPQSIGVQYVSQVYNKVGYNISTPELTIEMLETARKNNDADNILEYIDPAIKHSEKMTVYNNLLAEFSKEADLYLKSIDTNEDGYIVAKLVITETNGAQTENDTVKLIKKDDRWYISSDVVLTYDSLYN